RLGTTQRDEPQVQLLGLLPSGRGEANRVAQCEDRLIEITLELAGDAKVGSGAEVVGVVAVRGAEHADGHVDRTEADVQGAQVGGTANRERSGHGVSVAGPAGGR